LPTRTTCIMSSAWVNWLGTKPLQWWPLLGAETRQPTVASFSWGMYALVMVAIAANLSVLSPHGSLWAYERPVYGIVQRSLFAAWFLWSAGVGVILMRQLRR
jgi:hypothetical protein